MVLYLLSGNKDIMGHSRKEEIARLKRERREAKAAKKRQENVRELHVRFLIVCEGKKTEPLYFEALITNHTSTVREVTIEGEGRATVALVERTEEIRKDLERKNNMSFDRVWVVFDKDDFDLFAVAFFLHHGAEGFCERIVAGLVQGRKTDVFRSHTSGRSERRQDRNVLPVALFYQCELSGQDIDAVGDVIVVTVQFKVFIDETVDDVHFRVTDGLQPLFEGFCLFYPDILF